MYTRCVRKKDATILLRVTAPEKAIIAAQAAACEMSGQEWMRRTLLWAAGKREKRPQP